MRERTDRGPISVLSLCVVEYWDHFQTIVHKALDLRRNGTPPLFDVLPFEINMENYFLLIGIICTLFGHFLRSSVG